MDDNSTPSALGVLGAVAFSALAWAAVFIFFSFGN
jgi:hypothetical protein